MTGNIYVEYWCYLLPLWIHLLHFNVAHRKQPHGEFYITVASAGNLNTIYFYADAIFQILVGYFADRFGPK